MRFKLFELTQIDFDFYKQTMALLNYGWIEGRIAAEQMRDLTLDEFTAGLEASRELDASDDLPHVQCPVLVFHSRDQEEETPVAMSRRLAASLSNAELYIVEAKGWTSFFDEEGLLARAIIEFLDRDDPHMTTPANDRAGLTHRETEVLRLIVAGNSVREIATELVLSPRTVERHVASIYRKTDTHGRAQLAGFALRRNLV